MSSYTSGTVDVTNGSAVVVGTSTQWAAAILSGDYLTLDWLEDFEIATIDSDTQITLNRVFSGATAAAQSYAIKRVSLGHQSPSRIATALVDLKERIDDMINATGDDRGLTLDKAADTDNAFVRLRTNGAERWQFGAFGDDTLAFQRSPDGVTFETVLSFDRATGAVSLPTLDLTFDATEIGNDSGVVGTNVAEALDVLQAAIDAKEISIWYSGQGAPDAGIGDNGDFYIDTLTADLYSRSNGAWGADPDINIHGASSGTLFKFDTGIADADPGAGKFRLNHADPESVTALYVDNLENGGADVTAWLDTLDDSSSTIKGTIRLVDFLRPEIFALYNLTGSVVDGTGYRKLTVAHLASGGVWQADHIFALQFSATGDKGLDGLGTGDMQAAIYDPGGVGGDAFDMDNMSEGADAKIMTAAERTAIADAGGTTSAISSPENYGDGKSWWNSESGKLYLKTGGRFVQANHTANVPGNADNLQIATNLASINAHNARLNAVEAGPKLFTSGALILADGTTWAHGKTTIYAFGANLVCTVAEGSYAVGEKLPLLKDDGVSALNTVYADAVNIGYRTVGSIRFSDKSTSAAFVITEANWDVEFWIIAE